MDLILKGFLQESINVYPTSATSLSYLWLRNVCSLRSNVPKPDLVNVEGIHTLIFLKQPSTVFLKLGISIQRSEIKNTQCTFTFFFYLHVRRYILSKGFFFFFFLSELAVILTGACIISGKDV